jgi:hypothetical protein
MRFKIAILTAAVTLMAMVGYPTAAQADAASDLTACVTAINDPLYTKATLPVLILGAGKTQTDLESAITAGTFRVYVATGPGRITASASSSLQDIFCGDSNDNSVSDLDANTNQHDYFFGGGGNDSVTVGMWDSTFWGGLGSDYAISVQENSVFNGGPGFDSAGSTSTGGSFVQGADILEFSSFTLMGNPSKIDYRKSINITAVVDTDSRISFTELGKRIPRCLNIRTTRVNGYYNAVCPWSPTRIGYASLAASASPVLTGTGSAYVMTSKLFVSSRTGNR